MPQRESRGSLYFPTNIEDNCIAMSAVRQNPETVQNIEKNISVMQDPGVKSFVSSFDKEVEMGDTNIDFVSNGGALKITIDEGDGIKILSDTDISFTAGDHIAYYNFKEMKLEGTENVAFYQKEKSFHLHTPPEEPSEEEKAMALAALAAIATKGGS